MGLEPFRKSSPLRSSRWFSMVERRRSVFFASLGQEEHSPGLLPRLVGGLEAVEFGGWQVFDVGGDAHFVQEFQELGGGGAGRAGVSP